MSAHSTRQQRSIRTFLLAIALLLASAFATGTASANVLRPAVDIGAPGGGGGVAATTGETVDIANSDVPGIREF